MTNTVRNLSLLLVFVLTIVVMAGDPQIIEVFPPENFADVYFLEDTGHMTSFENTSADEFYILPDPETCRVDVYVRMPHEDYQHFQHFELCGAAPEMTAQPVLTIETLPLETMRMWLADEE